MRIHSHSSLGSFESCPRQYWYQYIGKPPVERVDTIEAFLGTCVHEACRAPSHESDPHPSPLPQAGEGAEALTPPSPRGRGSRSRGRVLSHEETLEGFETIWAKGWSDTIRIVSEELTAGDYKQQGQRLAGFPRSRE
jgi:hypothetical protein